MIPKLSVQQHRALVCVCLGSRRHGYETTTKVARAILPGKKEKSARKVLEALKEKGLVRSAGTDMWEDTELGWKTAFSAVFEEE